MVTWILDKLREIKPKELVADLEEVFKLNPDLEPELAATGAQIRDEAMKLSLN